MDEHKVKTPEELAHEMLRLFLASDPGTEAETGVPLENPAGVLASLEEWSSKHASAADGMTRIAVGAAPTGTAALPLAPLLTDLMECAIAFEQLTEQGVDEFLRLRPSRVYTAPNGTTKWALLTAITDRVALTREVLATTSPRSHRAAQPPSLGMHLTEAHHPEELRDALGLSLREALEIDEHRASDAAAKLFAPIIGLLKASSPELGSMVEWLLRNEPGALIEMPTTRLLIDAVQGNVDPRAEMQLRFAHLLDLGDFGFCAFVMWDTEAHLNRKERAALAGYIRHLADCAVAPWNRYSDLRRRREAFAIWVRQLRDEPVAAERLAEVLRSAHPADYESEPATRTVKRIYRISSEISAVRLSPSLVKSVR